MKQPVEGSSGVYARARQGLGSGAAVSSPQPGYASGFSTSEMDALETWAANEVYKKDNRVAGAPGHKAKETWGGNVANHLSDAQMKAWATQTAYMLDQDGDGNVTKEEVRKYFHQ